MKKIKLLLFVAPILFLEACLFAETEIKTPTFFKTDFQQANNALETVMPACEEQMKSGDLNGANEKLLAAFPASTRTPAQSFLLGNVLFEMDRTRSYALHRAAALAEPENPAVVWEWALEQHRAGEYLPALESYQKFSKARPDNAAPYALQADCLIRLNRINEAVEAWRKSELAPNGSVEQMEELICSVHREPTPHQRRAKLLAKAIQKQDVNAAYDLIALDCDFPRDWWNSGPYKSYLSHDLPAVKAALKLPDDDMCNRTISCAAECATADEEDAAGIKKILTKYRLLIDAPRTIPTNGALLSLILNAAVEAKAIDETVLHSQIAPLVLEQARKGKDKEMWNAALFAAPAGHSENQLKLEREGWQATGDVRFAAGVLLIKKESGQLTSNDTELKAALKQFPESGLIQRVSYEVAKVEKRVTKQQLADAAKAEFKHFTSFVAFATVVNRPRSDYLREYFGEMQNDKSAIK